MHPADAPRFRRSRGVLDARVRQLAEGRLQPATLPASAAAYPKIAWSGLGQAVEDTSVLLFFVKGRTAAESLTLPRPQVRLVDRWLEHSQLCGRWSRRRWPS
jgi:hypothetical protein